MFFSELICAVTGLTHSSGEGISHTIADALGHTSEKLSQHSHHVATTLASNALPTHHHEKSGDIKHAQHSPNLTDKGRSGEILS